MTQSRTGPGTLDADVSDATEAGPAVRAAFVAPRRGGYNFFQSPHRWARTHLSRGPLGPEQFRASAPDA